MTLRTKPEEHLQGSSFEVRLLQPGEEAVLSSVAADVFDDAVDVRAAREFLADPRHHLAVALADGVVIGFASGLHYVHPDKPSPELWINEVGVSPAHHRRGVGKALLQTLFEAAGRLGCREAWVLTERSNPPAWACTARSAARKRVKTPSCSPSGWMRTMQTLIKIEELALAALALFLFLGLDAAWWWFFALLLAPDLSMLGYLFGPRTGALAYNLVHHRGVAAALFLIGAAVHLEGLQAAGLILLGHASLDRVFGYGLKYPDSFQHTHLGWIGKGR